MTQNHLFLEQSLICYCLRTPKMSSGVAPPLVYYHYNNKTQKSAVHDDAVRQMSTPTILARRRLKRDNTTSYLQFEVFESLDHASSWIVRQPPHERCYLAMVDEGRPIEMFFDAEIRTDQLRFMPLATDGALTFDTQVVLFTLWMRCVVEVLSGVPMQRSGVWLWRADRPDKHSSHGHFPHCVFASVDVLSSYMRVLEDVLYINRNTMWAAQALCFADDQRIARRRPACYSRPSLSVSAKEEMIGDFGVYSRIRQMRLPLNRTAPNKNNPLWLWQPPNVQISENEAKQTPLDVNADVCPAHITSGDALRIGAICPREASWGTYRPALTDIYNWEQQVGHAARQLATTSLSPTSLRSESAADANALWTTIVTCTWKTFCDSLEPRLSPLGGVSDLATALNTLLLPVYAKIKDRNRRASSCHRLVWWIVLALRWRMPHGRRHTSKLNTTALLTDLTTCFVPMIDRYAVNDVPPMLDEAICVLKFIHTTYNAALCSRLSVDTYALRDQCNDYLVETHGGALEPIEIWQVVVGVVPLDIAYHMVTRAGAHEIASLQDLARIDALEAYMDDNIQELYTTVSQALTRGSIWRVPAQYMSMALSNTGLSGATRFAPHKAPSVSKQNDPDNSDGSSSSVRTTTTRPSGPLGTLDHNLTGLGTLSDLMMVASTTTGQNSASTSSVSQMSDFSLPPGTYHQTGWALNRVL